MKKKIALVLMFVFMGISFMGCGRTALSLVEENMSELTKVYYMAENENFYCTLASGVREQNYLMNGESGEVVDFALLTIVPNNDVKGVVVKAKVKIDGVEEDVELEVNGLNHNFMVDLEKQLTGDEVVEVVYCGEVLCLENVSQAFEIDYKRALEIASEKLKDAIVAKQKFSKLNAECYLRVLDKKANQFDNVFWCFTVLNIDNESFSIIISTVDGSILAESN